MDETCSTVKAAVQEYLVGRVRMSSVDDKCVITLPVPTFDGRRVSVVVEPVWSGLFRVHDGGKTESELFCQGARMTERKMATRQAIAQRFGASMADGLIQKGAGPGELPEAVMAVANCSAALMNELASLSAEIEGERVSSIVHRALRAWKPAYIDRIERNARVRGFSAVHRFSFITYPARVGHRIAALKVLSSNHPRWQAERYGFLGLDLQKVGVYDGWSRLAIVPRAETWPKAALEIVNEFSTEVLEFRSGEEGLAASVVTEAVAKASRAA